MDEKKPRQRNKNRRQKTAISRAEAGQPLALVVMAREKQTAVPEILKGMGFRIAKAEGCRHAQRLMRSGSVPAMVITDTSLSDGNWCDVVRLTVDLKVESPVLLCCRSADERLWSEAVWRGVCDLLVEPFEPEEVRWVIESALRRGERNHSAQARRAPSNKRGARVDFGRPC